MGLFNFFRRRQSEAPTARIEQGEVKSPGEPLTGSSERGYRPTPENSARYIYRDMWVDPDLRASIMDIRHMDRIDGRVKQIHRKTARAATKGGLILRVSDGPKWLHREWHAYSMRCDLYRREKLQSDIRGLMMEGNLPIQWVLDDANRVAAGVRMPADTLLPRVGPNGRFIDVSRAYDQIDLAGLGGHPVVASFALWQLTLGRLDPDNYDDWGAMGRPYLDASRPIWKKLAMTEEDLVVRRRTRAPLRQSHVLEGASNEDLQDYRAEVEADQGQGNWKDYYSNKKGSVTPVQGDANLDQIADVSYLLDGFFTGAPAPKGLFGLGVGELNRDILDDLKQDFFDELDAMQDTASGVYEQGFRLHLLLAGKNPDSYDFDVQFRERKTDTQNQRADHALKLQALGLSRETVWETAGIDVAAERNRLDRQRAEKDPYPVPGMDGPKPGTPRVSVTPGNAPKGASATSITTRAPE